MENERESLEQKLEDLRNRLDQLENEWRTLRWTALRMTDSKLTNPRHALLDWELQALQSEQRQAQFRAAMTALQNRLLGNSTPEHEQIEVEGISREKLYAPTRPTIEEVLDTLKIIVREDEAGIVEMMLAARHEREPGVEYFDLAEFVLNSLKPR
jgi:cystathionine beta-lyase/cystathionine gamma-synthase